MNPTPASIGIAALVVFLAIVSGLWIGLFSLRKVRRGLTWWLMFVGMVLFSIGPILLGFGIWGLFTAMTGPSSMFPRWDVELVATILAAIIPCGLLLFSIGFCMHAMAAARMAARAEELEQLSTALAGDLSELRDRKPLAR
ncbi:hypothetical protein OKA04_13915 [Luteolibacter flavescens]|uniref:DUF2304 domain-containing protein n=1 Tax=Luteolibacter flavescens TaxID=1859460 RepID=A0ABT3FQU1_9BACT|nr:hypothetical protein [Luteolibacter flavescens]MCW1885832.1 hypothetical protein [Luteolibacter flavescens]